MYTAVCFSLSFPESGNKDLAINLAAWVFKEKGVLRAGKVTHHKVGDTKPPVAYTITDDVVRFSKVLISGRFVCVCHLGRLSHFENGVAKGIMIVLPSWKNSQPLPRRLLDASTANSPPPTHTSLHINTSQSRDSCTRPLC